MIAQERSSLYPLVMAGGIACFLNPEPISDFIDCFVIGEAEPVIDRFFNIFDPEMERKKTLAILASELDGVYVPLFYDVKYNNDKTIYSFEPKSSAPKKIKRLYSNDLSRVATASCIITPNTVFSRTYLMEVGRGCPYGCRFCSAGYVYRPPRYKPLNQLKEMLGEGIAITDRIGLIGSTITDYPGLKDLLSEAEENKIKVSFSSLRADRLFFGSNFRIDKKRCKNGNHSAGCRL